MILLNIIQSLTLLIEHLFLLLQAYAWVECLVLVGFIVFSAVLLVLSRKITNYEDLK